MIEFEANPTGGQLKEKHFEGSNTAIFTGDWLYLQLMEVTGKEIDCQGHTFGKYGDEWSTRYGVYFHTCSEILMRNFVSVCKEGSVINIKSKSKNIKLHNFKIYNSGFAGVLAKSDDDPDAYIDYLEFKDFLISGFDGDMHEGFYIGQTKGAETNYHLIGTVTLENGSVVHTGRECIQTSSVQNLQIANCNFIDGGLFAISQQANNFQFANTSGMVSHTIFQKGYEMLGNIRATDFEFNKCLFIGRDNQWMAYFGEYPGKYNEDMPIGAITFEDCWFSEFDDEIWAKVAYTRDQVIFRNCYFSQEPNFKKMSSNVDIVLLNNVYNADIPTPEYDDQWKVKGFWKEQGIGNLSDIDEPPGVEEPIIIDIPEGYHISKIVLKKTK